MILKKYNIKVPDSILIIKGKHALEFGQHYVFQYNGSDYIEILYVDGENDECRYWETYTETEIYELFFDGTIEYIECSLLKFNNIKLFI